MKNVAMMGVTLLTTLSGCNQRPEQSSEAERDLAPARAEEGSGKAASANATSASAANDNEPSTLKVAGAAHQPNTLNVAGVAACRPSEEVRNTVSRAVELADTDGNGQVSRTEAQSAVNFVLGGLFFRADQNSDGKLTRDERQQARRELEAQYPAVASMLMRASEATGPRPFAAFAEMMNIDTDKAWTTDEIRQASGQALDDLYRLADENKDQVITRAEANTASVEAAKSLATRAFSAADTNSDQFLDNGEFQKVLDNSAQTVFALADGNKDGRLSRDEAAIAVANVGRRLGIPNAKNTAESKAQ